MFPDIQVEVPRFSGIVITWLGFFFTPVWTVEVIFLAFICVGLGAPLLVPANSVYTQVSILQGNAFTDFSPSAYKESTI